MFGLYVIGILAAIITGFLVKRIVLPGDVSPFVMEIPPYHVPTIKGVLLRTWDRLKSFIAHATADSDHRHSTRILEFLGD